MLVRFVSFILCAEREPQFLVTGGLTAPAIEPVEE